MLIVNGDGLTEAFLILKKKKTITNMMEELGKTRINDGRWQKRSGNIDNSTCRGVTMRGMGYTFGLPAIEERTEGGKAQPKD